MDTTQANLIANVKQIISRLSDLEGMSNNLNDLILNINLLILYVTHNKIEEISEWITVYDVQSFMTVRGSLVSCTVHPNTLPLEEANLLHEEIGILTNFVEYVRKNYVSKIA